MAERVYYGYVTFKDGTTICHCYGGLYEVMVSEVEVLCRASKEVVEFKRKAC